MNKIAITIAGLDPSAGAGLAADLKTFAAWGVFGVAAATALTIQSTVGVERVEPVEAGFVGRTLASLASDLEIAVVKLGMLASEANAAAVVRWLDEHPGLPVVTDPVLVSTSGHPLLPAAGLEVLQREILPRSAWVTPNISELAVLTGMPVRDGGEIQAAAEALAAMAPRAHVLVTGGHMETPDDYLLAPGAKQGEWIAGEHVVSRSTHGTGCTLASSVAACTARWPEAPARDIVTACKRYLEGAIRHAPDIGHGAGPLEHFWRPVPTSLQAKE